MSTLIPTGFGNITVLRGSKYVGVWDWEETDFTGNTATIKIKNIHEQFKDVKNVYEVGVATVCPLDIDGNPYTNRIQIELSKEDTLKFAIPASEDFSFGEESGYYSVLNIILDDGAVVLTANVKVVNSLEAETLNFLLDEKDEAIIINRKLDDILLRNDEYISARDNLIDVVIPEAINTYDEKLQAYNLNHIEKVQILEDIATIVGQDKNIVGQDKLDIETMKQNVQDNKDSVTSMKDAIEIMLDTFDDRFLGKKDSDPTTDNDGEPLSIAALYYNEIDKELKFYNGVSWDSPVAAAQTYAQQASQSADSANASKLAVLNVKTDVETIRDSLQASVNDIANKVNISDVQDLLNSTDPTKPLSANQGKILKGYIDTINSLLLSDNTTLDSLQEIVDFIEMNRATLETLGISNIAGLQNALNAKQTIIQDGGLPILKLDIDGATDIGANLVDTDLFVVDDGANGTNRKSAISRIWTYISGKLTGAISTVLTSNLTASKVLISDVSGKIEVSGVSSTTLGYLDATSSVQTQLNAKAALSSPALTGTPTINGVNVSGYSGFKNYIINGNFDIWQRGNGPFTNYNYGADRWICYHPTATIHSSSTGSNGIQKRIAHIKNASAGMIFLAQPIELPLIGFGHPFVVGKKFTVSVRYSSTTKIRPILIFRDSAAGTNPVNLDSSMAAPVYKGGSGVDEVVSWTFTVDGTAANTNTCLLLSLQSESNASDVYMYQVQLEEGSVATPFENRPYGLELSLCQRYYQIVRLGLYNNTGNTTVLGGSITFPTKMRVTPSIGLLNGAPVTYQNLTLEGVEYHSTVTTGLWNQGIHYASAEL